MLINEFIEATSRLENYYGKEYQTIQRQIMFEELKDLKIERYKKLCSAIMRKSKYLPKIADFIEANNEVPFETKTNSEQVECNVCNGSGYVFYKKVIEDFVYDYVCRCTCSNAQNKNKEIPTYKQLGIM